MGMTPTTVNENTEGLRKAAIMRVMQEHPFRPAWWLQGAHAQTLWAPLFRRRPEVERVREDWTTPDGDSIALYFRNGRQGAPLVLLLHGLEGSGESKYALGMMRNLAAIGWSSAVLVFRGCGAELNKLPRMYHSGETTDLAFVVERLCDRYATLYAAGVSLGGNVLAKWLGEQGDSAPPELRAAAVVSAPYDLMISGPTIDSAFGGLYSRHFLRTLKAKALQKARQHPGLVDVNRTRACKNLYEFDNCVTAPVHGFRDTEHYWSSQGCGQFLARIRRPTLLIGACDDPFNPRETLPRESAERSDYLYPLFTERGGHVGFVSDASPLRPRYWAEEQVVRFFQAQESYRSE